MKQQFKALFIILLSFTSISLYAQSKMVKYFNMLPSDKRHNVKVTEKGGKFKTDIETPNSIVVDDKNGFLQIVDDGTGGGKLTYQLAMFKDATGKVVLGFNTFGFDGVMYDNVNLTFYEPDNKMTDVTKKVFGVKIEDSDYQKAPYKGTAKLRDFVSKENSTEYTYYNLPRQGLEIKVFHGYVALDNACKFERNKEACYFLEQFRPFVTVKWDKAKGIFVK